MDQCKIKIIFRFGKKWAVVFDQAKLLYNVYKDWKLGLMYGQKNSW